MTSEVPEENIYDPSLPPPRFDAHASASAKPVEPIQRNRLSAVRERLSSLGSRISGQSRALLLVIVIGLLTGAVGGMFLVKVVKSSTPDAPPAPAMSAESGIGAAEIQQLDAFATELAADAQSRVRSTSRTRRVRQRSNGVSAYRVAVIR